MIRLSLFAVRVRRGVVEAVERERRVVGHIEGDHCGPWSVREPHTWFAYALDELDAYRMVQKALTELTK